MGLFDKLTTVLPDLPDFNTKKDPKPQVIERHKFIIKELAGPKGLVVLEAQQLPHEKLPFGGTQRLVKDYYPGNSEPVMHVLGSQESDIEITGRFYDKQVSRAGASINTAKLLDAFRIRGNLLEISWGEFRRYAVLEETKFDLKTTKDIDYSLKFSILGFNPPRDCPILNKNDVPFDINTELVAQVAKFKSLAYEEGIKLDRDLFDDLNDLISDVATAVTAVTNFVSDVIGVAEDAVRTVNRAAGVINHAMANISRFATRVRRLKFASFNSFKIGTQLHIRPIADSFRTNIVIRLRVKQAFAMMQLLLRMREQLQQLALKLPIARHLTQGGDTLQSVAFKYYGDSSLWLKIKEHNGLQTTTLAPGMVLEIPK